MQVLRKKETLWQSNLIRLFLYLSTLVQNTLVQKQWSLNQCIISNHISLALQRLTYLIIYVTLVIMQGMIIDDLDMEEQLANLKAIEGLTKYVQNQVSQIDKLVDKKDGRIYEESFHEPRKNLEVHETEPIVKQTPPAKELQVSSKEIIPIDQLNKFIEGTLKEKYDVVSNSFLTYSKPYTARIVSLKMSIGYLPLKF